MVDLSEHADREPDDRPPLRLVASSTGPVVDTPDPRSAVHDLYQEHYPALLRLAGLLTGSQAAAEDLAHDAFARLYANFQRVREPLAYLRTSVVNGARGAWRRRDTATRHPEPHVPDAASAEDAALGRVDRDRVLHALGALPDRQRSCVVLRHFLRMTEGEIASTLGISVGSVRTHVHRGESSLARHLGGLR